MKCRKDFKENYLPYSEDQLKKMHVRDVMLSFKDKIDYWQADKECHKFMWNSKQKSRNSFLLILEFLPFSPIKIAHFLKLMRKLGLAFFRRFVSKSFQFNWHRHMKENDNMWHTVGNLVPKNKFVKNNSFTIFVCSNSS